MVAPSYTLSSLCCFSPLYSSVVLYGNETRHDHLRINGKPHPHELVEGQEGKEAKGEEGPNKVTPIILVSHPLPFPLPSFVPAQYVQYVFRLYFTLTFLCLLFVLLLWVSTLLLPSFSSRFFFFFTLPLFLFPRKQFSNVLHVCWNHRMKEAHEGGGGKRP